jgi:hypothetical protein
MSSASRLTLHKNVRFLKTFHCFIPARWTNQQAAGGASSSAAQVTKKVAEGKGRVDTPAGRHPLSKTDVQKLTVVRKENWQFRAEHAIGMEETRNTYKIILREISWKT